jgi:hypothetical protein
MASERTLREAVSADVAGIAICLPADLPVVTTDEQGIVSVLIVRCPGDGRQGRQS